VSIYLAPDTNVCHHNGTEANNGAYMTKLKVELFAKIESVQKAIKTMETFWDCWELGDEKSYENLKKELAELEEAYNA
jgi:hypothetical protein